MQLIRLLLAAWMFLVSTGLAQAATWYGDTTASGAGDGTSWTDAYTNLQAALDEAQSGDTVYLNAPRHAWYAGWLSLTDKTGVNVICDKGTHGETWQFGGVVRDDWTDVGGGTNDFSVSGLGAEPVHVAYDMKQDDYAGTVTGVAITPEVAAYCVWAGHHPSKARAWYGFLPKTAGTQTAPGDGEYGYASGVLYVDPPGTPVLATVEPLIYFSSPDQVSGFQATSCNNCRVSGLTAYWNPAISGNRYGLMGFNCVNVEFANCNAHVSGWHSMGFAGASVGVTGDYDCRMTDCLANGLTGAETTTADINPFVFYQHNTPPTRYGNNYGTRCVSICLPRLRYTGAPTYTTYLPIGFQSHGVSGTSNNDIFWRDCVMLEFTDQLNAKHSQSNNWMAFGGFYLASHTTTATGTDFSTYPVRMTRCISYGRTLPYQSSQVSFDRMLIDRSDVTSTNEYHVNSAAANIYFKECTVLCGGVNNALINAISDTDKIVFDGGRYLITSSALRTGLVLMWDYNNTDSVIFKNGVEIDGNDANEQVVAIANAPSNYTIGPTDISSDGTLRFGNGLEAGGVTAGFWRHNNASIASQPLTYWQANVTGASTDQGGLNLGWGATAAEKKHWLIKKWFEENPSSKPNGTSAIMVVQ